MCECPVLTLNTMAGFNRCRSGELEFKRARALKLRQDDPNLTADTLATRLNVSKHTMRAWLEGAGEERAEDARGLAQRRAAQQRRDALGEAEYISRSALESLEAFAAGEAEGGVTARPRNDVVESLCPEAL